MNRDRPLTSNAVAPTDLRVSIAPVWPQVRKLRGDVADALAAFPAELKSAATMVASELIENAIKYGETIDAAPNILFSLVAGAAEIRIQTVNGSTNLHGVNRLLHLVDELSRTADKAALYLARQEQLLADPNESGSLGLYRIAFEGEFDLTCTYHERFVTVTATRKIP
jgi:hypothetical protein